MTITKLAAGAAGALIIAFAGTAALAGDGGYLCQTRNMAKNTPAVTHCVTWTHQGAARLKAAGCDPATMAYAQMQANCAQLMANPAAG